MHTERRECESLSSLRADDVVAYMNVQVRVGFFLHSPFPSSEIFRAFPMREELLRGLLNADLVGFHTFDYARHFLSCCSRMLGLDFQSKRGSIALEYFGRSGALPSPSFRSKPRPVSFTVQNGICSFLLAMLWPHQEKAEVIYAQGGCLT